MPKIRSLSLMGNQGPHFELLAKGGFEVVLKPEGKNPFVEDDLIEMLSDCEAVIAGSEPYTARVIEALPELRHIARSGVGFDAVDLAACDAHEIVVTTTPGVNHHAVAELAITMLMSLARGFPGLDRRTRVNDWRRSPLPRVMGSTLGIVGLGRIGRAVCTRAIGLGMNVLAFEPYPNREFVEQWDVELTELDDLLRQSDFVTLHSPSTPETHQLMNTESIAKMKPGSILINTARGSLIDETSLMQALQSGHLRGAGLDVFEVEPPSIDNPLLKMDNVLLSCHVGGLDQTSHHDTFTMVANTVLQLYNGGWPSECIINLKNAENWQWGSET
ncbi:MAG: 3-phosphoglycerate dehydrogenase [Planctomycetaceae bacterium]|nr:3-phosphoglycerate dehydrogenase [Planctomycetaceae bacterium]